MRRTIIALLGIPVMVLGLVGWVMPIIPGAPIFLIGLAMCISWHPRGRLAVKKTKTAFKNLATRAGLGPKKKTDLTEELFKPNLPEHSTPTTRP